MWTEEEKLSLPKKYNCQLLLTEQTESQVKDTGLPRDAYLVYYENSEGKLSLDVCRSSKLTNLFDLYYDKFKNVKKIDFGYGNANPRLWSEVEKKKRSKK